MYFNFKINQVKSNQKFTFTKNTKVYIEDTKLTPYVSSLIETKLKPFNVDGKEIKEIALKLGYDGNDTGVTPTLNDEEYLISVGETTKVFAKTPAGLLFAVSTLIQMVEFNELNERVIYDYPTLAFRGYRIFVPGRENIQTFKDVIDFLAYYKYNRIILEIGGAMEYKRHPEINDAWVEFCKEVFSYNGRADEIQLHTYPWEKDSIHCDNGDGGYLTQEECRDLKRYCEERGIEVVPECPSFSHSDYMVIPHPELRERPEDDYADTYCPSNPDSYKLLFDLLDEVIEVWAPKTINIGHDELYSIGVCPKCREKNPVDIYIEDITKIKNYLNSKGISVFMWGEKLLKAVDEEGNKWAGWFDPRTRNGATYQIPWLYECAERMPEGLTFLHWYWNFDYNLDDVYHSHNYPMMFGNFTAINCKKYRERINKGVKGAFASNWGCFKPEYMQRNMQYFDLIGNAYAVWCEDFDTEDGKKEFYLQKILNECFRKHYYGKQNLIEVVHTTNLYIPYKFFHDGTFIDDEVYLLGNYVLTYADGETATFPVIYGTNISNNEKETRETNGSCLIEKHGDKVYYKTMFVNPQPEKEVLSFEYKPVMQNAEVETLSVKF